MTGLYGVITINADGSYSYVVDNLNVAVQGLRTSANTLQDIFTYTQQDAGGLSSTAQVTITIQGRNDNPHDLTSGALTIHENVADGTVVGTMTGHDVDVGDTRTYSLIDSAGGRFAIDASTGQITVNNGSLLNFEASPSHQITVRVTDAGGLALERSITITVNDVDEFDVGFISDISSVSDGVIENAVPGTLVGITASASDEDAGTNAITYTLDDDAGGRFAIDASTGVVTVAGVIDRELSASYLIRVRAASSDGSFTLQDFAIQVEDVNEFDVSPLVDTDSSANVVGENAMDGSVVGLVALGVDGDATQSQVSYSLVDDAGGRFAIDAVTGEVRVASGDRLDFESQASHVIRVRVDSSDGSSAEQAFTIWVEDRQEAPRGVSVQYATTFIENVVVGSPGLLANASDPDGDSLSVIVVSGPANGTLTWGGDGSFVYEPVIGVTGIETIVYRVFDGVDVSGDLTITIAVVMPAVQAPVASSGGGGAVSASSDTAGESANADSSSDRDSNSSNDNAVQPLALGLGGVEEGQKDVEGNQEVVLVAIAPSSSLAQKLTNQALFPLGVTETAVGIDGLLRSIGQSLEDSLETRNWDEQGKSVRSVWEASSQVRLSIDGDDHREMERSAEAFESMDQLVMQTVIGTGALIWVVQGLQILATLLSATPAWLHMDPLNIVSTSTQREKEEFEEASDEERLFDGEHPRTKRSSVVGGVRRYEGFTSSSKGVGMLRRRG